MSAGQLSLFTDTSSPRPPAAHYPERPGFKAFGASEEAARHVVGDASRLRAQVFAELKLWPAGRTADELARLLHRDRLSIRPRISELKATGKIIATGERRRNESGMSASVWQVMS